MIKRFLIAFAVLVATLAFSIHNSPALAYGGCPGDQQSIMATYAGTYWNYNYAGSVNNVWGYVRVGTVEPYAGYWAQSWRIQTYSYFIKSIRVTYTGGWAWKGSSTYYPPYGQTSWFSFPQITPSYNWRPNPVIGSVFACLSNTP